MTQNFFAGIESVDATGMRLPRVPDGSHLLLVDRCLIPQAQGKGNAFVVEFTVQQSHNPNFAPGSKCSVYLSSNYRDSWLKQVKAFAAAACGYDLRVPEQDAAFGPYANNAVSASVGQENALVGRVVVCEGSFSGKYDKQQRPYFNYVWWPYGDMMNLGAFPAPAYQAPQRYAPQYQGPPPGQPAYGPPQQGFAPPGQPAYGPSGSQYGAPQGPPGVPPQAWGAQQAPQGPPQQQGFAPPGGAPQGSPFGGWRR